MEISNNSIRPQIAIQQNTNDPRNSNTQVQDNLQINAPVAPIDRSTTAEPVQQITRNEQVQNENNERIKNENNEQVKNENNEQVIRQQAKTLSPQDTIGNRLDIRI